MAHRRRQLKRRRARPAFVWFLLIAVLFWTGYLGATHLYGSNSWLRHQPPASLATLFKGQYFFAGDPRSLPGFGANLPTLSEWEGMSTLLRWDVSYSDEEADGMPIPVFVHSALDSSGQTVGNVTALARPQATNLVLTPVEDDTVKVLIYATHTSESYDGGGGVVDVGQHLATTLQEQYGIGTVVSSQVHDSPEWYRSYANSRQTAEELLAAYPDAQLLIDLHRDSGPSKKDTTTAIDGESAAKLLLVVGSNMTQEHPHWEQNYATAQAVGAAIDNINGDILRGVRIQKGRYNQHLTANAILIEVGCNLNTLAEAEIAVEVFAAAINQYLAN